MIVVVKSVTLALALAQRPDAWQGWGFETEYFRLNENTIKNDNSTKFANGARRVLAAVKFLILLL